jgi:FAD/FMN-containing dehydrogenase
MQTDERMIRDMMPDGALLPDDAGYDAARISFNGILDRRPAVIVSCSSTPDVVAAVRAARAAGLPIAIRGGGHSVAGHSLPDGALVVSLDRMRNIEVDPRRRLAYAGGGALWEDIDPAAFAHGFAVPGGTFGDTGIGGLTLGGGLGWLMPIAGLTCDNLIEAEVVTADGTVVTAGPSDDAELLWALRGGGGNFGVVTRFTFRLTPVGPMWGGTIRYAGAAAREVFARVEEVFAANPTAAMPTFGIHRDPDIGPSISLLLAIVDGTDPEAIAAPLRRDLPITSEEVGPKTYLELQAQAGMLPFGLRHYWKGHFVRELPDELLDELLRRIVALGRPPGGILIESIHGAPKDADEASGVVGFRHAAFNITAMATWQDPALDEEYIAWARDTAAAIEPWSLGGYVNYMQADEPVERLRAAVGADAFERLQAVKQRYDPTNVLRRNQNIPPA